MPGSSQPTMTYLKCSQSSAIFGVYPNKMYRDAIALEEELLANDENGWNEWPLLAADGATAALLSLVSDGKVNLIPQYVSGTSYAFPG